MNPFVLTRESLNKQIDELKNEPMRSDPAMMILDKSGALCRASIKYYPWADVLGWKIRSIIP